MQSLSSCENKSQPWTKIRSKRKGVRVLLAILRWNHLDLQLKYAISSVLATAKLLQNPSRHLLFQEDHDDSSEFDIIIEQGYLKNKNKIKILQDEERRSYFM